MFKDKYTQFYNAATRRVLELAEEIDTRTDDVLFERRYALRDIVLVLRKNYQDYLFRDKYMGNMQFVGFNAYPKGFCALSMICIYKLYGGGDVWIPSAIRLGAWENAPVVFLREKLTGRVFDVTCDQFFTLDNNDNFKQMDIPYYLGTPINRTVEQMRTPKKKEFVDDIVKDLNER